MKKSLTGIALLLFGISVAGCTYEKHMIPDGKGGMIEEKRIKGSDKVEYERVSPKPVKVEYDD